LKKKYPLIFDQLFALFRFKENQVDNSVQLDEIPDSWKDYIDAGVIRARRNQIFMPYPFLKEFWSDNATVFSKEDMDLIWTDSTQSHNDSTDKGYSFQIGVAMELLFQSKSKLFLAIYNKIKEITGLKLDIQIPSNFDKFRKIDRFNTDVELKEKKRSIMYGG